MPSTHSVGYQPSIQTRVYPKHTKVPLATLANSAFPRRNSQFSYSQSVSQCRKSNKVHTNITSFSTTNSPHSKNGDGSFRHDDFLHSHSITRLSTYASPSTHSTISMFSSEGASTRTSVGRAATHRSLQCLNSNNLLQSQHLKVPIIQIIITTDASLQGYGAHMQDLTVHGLWTITQTHLHINHLELIAIQLALKAFRKHLHHKIVLIRTDNMTAMLSLLSERIWH